MTKVCQPHWNLMRGQIEDFGMGHLVVDQNEMTGIIHRALAGISMPDDFDPLLFANFLVWRDAMDEYGVEKIAHGHCPLCIHLDEGGSAKAWIVSAVDTALIEARRLGLVPSLQ